MKNGPGDSKGFQHGHEAVLVGLLCALALTAAVLEPAFLRWDVQRELSSHLWELAIVAVPMTLIVIAGGIDLSVGAIMAMAAIALGLCYRNGGSPFWGAGIGIAVGTLCGMLNGWFVIWARVHPLVVTLATMAAFRGMAEGISLAKPVSGFPDAFAALGQGLWLGLPVPFYFFLPLIMGALWFLGTTPWGRFCYAIGNNEVATRLSGIPVDRIKFFLYSASGFCAGLAAVLFVARRNTAKADIGMGMELNVISAVVVGGVSIYGGQGHLRGTLMGLLLIHEVREFLTWRWNREELNLIAVGALLIAAVLIHRRLTVKGPCD